MMSDIHEWRRILTEMNEANDHHHAGTPPTYEASDSEHYDALDKTGFFGKQGAGCLILAKNTGRFMLVLRSPEVLESNQWGNVGGAHSASEPAETAAEREMYEETGYRGEADLYPMYVFHDKKSGFIYRNFLAVIDDEFTPHLGWEATSFKWCTLDTLPSPLHYGVKAVFGDTASVKLIGKFSN
jgi:8-oxo-dGTP pyrophosphatase MutT (NUDIX family)